ncbi:MAG: restriction endonuclease subunit S, partial [Candidatus Avigastranaerophilus sp.]
MNKNLDNKTWKVFHLSDIFINYHGKRLTKEYRKAGKTPLLTASESNQGVSDYIADSLNMTKHKNFISIDMFGHAFYHNYGCYGDDNIYFFKNDKISKCAKLFIVSCINKNSYKYSYGNQFRQDNADKDKILLPVNFKGEPDYEFMEEYIKEREEKLKQRYREHVENRVKKLFNTINLKKEWTAYKIEDVFNILSGKRLTQAEMISGDMPFVSAAAINNGITSFIGNNNSSLDKNVLGVNYDGNGGMAISFFHPYSCLFSDSVKRFHLKNYTDNKYTLLFLKQTILKQREKYVYGYKFNETRMKKQKIMLPTNSKGEPDYKYMEDYMKYLEQKKLLEYLEY